MSILSRYDDPTTLPASEPVRMAMILGLRRPATIDDAKLARRIEEGLPLRSAEVFRRIVDRFGRNAIYSVVSEPTLRRAKSRGSLTPMSSERLYEVGRVIDGAARAFRGDEGRIERFMTRPHPLLDGRTPFDVARSSSAGVEAVLRILGEAEAGVAV